MSEIIAINLTTALANKGKTFTFDSEISLPDGLLNYPSAHFDSAKVNFVYYCDGENVNVEGDICCTVTGQCDRCYGNTKNSYVFAFNQMFFKDGTADVEYTYNGYILDATKAVWDEIVLSLPTVFLCLETCKGLCPKCGINLNHETCDCDLNRDNAFSVLKNLKF